MPKFLVDESTGKKLSIFLNNSGFDSIYVGDVFAGAVDEDVLKFAEKEKRVLITNDKDFGEMIFHQIKPSSGVILLRLANDSREKRQEILSIILRDFADKIESHLIVATEEKIRIRKIEK